MGIILWAILIYFMYLFLVKFLIPIFRTTHQIKRKMQEMQSQQSDYARERRNPEPHIVSDKSTSSEETYADKGEYIDFEEVKERQ